MSELWQDKVVTFLGTQCTLHCVTVIVV